MEALRYHAMSSASSSGAIAFLADRWESDCIGETAKAQDGDPEKANKSAGGAEEEAKEVDAVKRTNA